MERDEAPDGRAPPAEEDGPPKVGMQEPTDDPVPPGEQDEPPEDPRELPEGVECLDTAGRISLELPLELPALVRTEAPAPMLYFDQGLKQAPIGSDVAVTVALGTEAPSAVRMQLGAAFDLECGDPEGTFTIDSIEVLQGEARGKKEEEPSIVLIEADVAGDSLIEVRGVLSIAGGGPCSDVPMEVPLVYSLNVHAEEFEWSAEATETCPPSVASGRPLPARVVARDAEGQIRTPMNLARPALSVSATDGVVLSTHDEDNLFSSQFASGVMPTGSGTVTVALVDGSSAVDIQVFEPDELSGVYLAFWLSGVVARADVPLDDGASYEFVGEYPQIDVRARWVAHEGVWMCGAPDAEDFFITSLTPDVCQVSARTCSIDDGLIGSLLPESVAVLADGTCTLRVDAPGFANGAGASQEFSVELTNQNFAAD